LRHTIPFGKKDNWEVRFYEQKLSFKYFSILELCNAMARKYWFILNCNLKKYILNINMWKFIKIHKYTIKLSIFVKYVFNLKTEKKNAKVKNVKP